MSNDLQDLVHSLPFALCASDGDKNGVFAMFQNKTLADEFFNQSVSPRLREGQQENWFILNIAANQTFPVTTS